MDDFNSLIPSHQDDPFLLQYTTIPTVPFLDHTILQDLGNHAPPPPPPLTSPREESELLPTTTNCKRHQKPSNIQNNDMGNPVGDTKEKRAVHRDIERQRRQEMANLYASLRTLLPLEYIKGKRAVTDHVHQAVNYIKHMEKNIRELEVKRNRLRKLLGQSNLDVQNEKRSSSSNIAFTVGSCSGGGIEILMKRDLADDSLPLSRVLDVLVSEGLTVVSCVYTKVNQKFHCTIQTDEASQMNDVDLFFLQEKLNEKVNACKNFQF